VVVVGISVLAAAKHGPESMYVGIAAFVIVGGYFGWLALRVRFLCSILLSEEGVSQLAEGLKGLFAPRRFALWSEITDISMEGYKVELFRGSEKFVVNVALMNSGVERSLVRLKELLPSHLNAS
jgi:hypothetical protein